MPRVKAASAAPAPKPLVRMFPTADAYVVGVPAIPLLATPAQAARLLEFRPPAFTRRAPKGTPRDVELTDLSATLDQLLPPAAAKE